MPDAARFNSAGAGCTQRLDLPGGDILLPAYFKRAEQRQYSATVVRCRFDGQRLTYIQHGDELTIPVQEGFTEPSLTRFRDRFYLTLRNEATFGYFDVGAEVTIPLNFIASDYGSWELTL